MAPVGESCYFPPLDRCLDGRHQLFSWKTTFVGLSQLGDVSDNGSLRRHVTDHQTFDLLTRPFSPYSAPSAQSKSSFETKTSAINVSLSAYGRYNIKEIQEDALWLSKKTNISETEALRIAVLEWQTRPAERLLLDSPYDEAKDLRKIVCTSGLAASLRDSTQSRPLLSEQESLNAFDSSEARRERLLYIYLSERRYILKTAEYLLSVALFSASPRVESSPGSKSKGKAPDRSDRPDDRGWVEEVGKNISKVWNPDGVLQDSGDNFIVVAVSALQFRADCLENGSRWFEDENPREDIEAAWGRNQILEMIHIMQATLTLLDFSARLTRSDALLAWFNFVTKYDYFQHIHESFLPIYELPLHSLVMLISLALLDIPKALHMISKISLAPMSQASSEYDTPYLLNPGVITTINGILMTAAKACFANASPAVLAWCVILQTIRGYAIASRDSREIRQAQRAADGYHVADSSDTDGVELKKNGPSLQRPSSASSETSQQLSFFEDILERIIVSEEEDPISYLAKSAVDKCGVFHIVTAVVTDYCIAFESDKHGKSGLRIRRMLLELIQAVLEWIEYQPTLILTTLTILTGNERYWDTFNRPQSLISAEPATLFLRDDLLMQKLLHIALNRFPYETLPFLKLCRALAVSNAENEEELPTVWLLLKELDSLTCLVPKDFPAYEIIREDEDANYIQLTCSLNFIEDLSQSRTIHPSKQPSRASKDIIPLPAEQLPPGTVGRVLSESKPLVVMWTYDYSPLAYLSKILSYFSIDGTFSSPASERREIVSEIIDLFTILISSATRRALDVEGSKVLDAAQTILENASDGLDRGQDVISVIFVIFENELHRRPGPSGEEGTLDILISCVQFAYALLPVMPDRVWPFLGRSSLLSIDGSESQLNAIIASNEIVSGHYGFLFGCIRVFDALVEDAIARAVSYQIPSTAIKRFASTDNHGTGISQTAVEKVMISLQRTMVDVFDSTLNWKFSIQEERSEITTWICTIFEKILSNCFDVEDHKLSKPLAPAAENLLNSFLSTSNSNLTINPLLRILFEGVATPNSSLSVRGLQHWTSRVRSALCFSASLIRVSTFLKRPPSHLQREMFKATAVLAKIYAAHESYRLPTVELFDALICSIDGTDQQPPSLLGHLGRDTASHFLELLAMVDQPFNDNILSVGIWRLLSTIVSRRQQWFAIFVLTGNTPRESFKDSGKINGSLSQRAEPLLTIALDGLSNIERVEPMNAIAMLEFIALAADYWPWVLTIIDEHPHFLTAMAEFIANPDPTQSSTQGKSNNTSTDFARLQISSVILDTFAMYINYTQQTGNLAFAKKLLPSLTFYTQHAVSVPGFNVSLHTRLRHNFTSKFVGCTLDEFKQTTVKKPSLGRSFYYNLEIANKMLSFDASWAGRYGQGFANEMERANLNLSLVEAQVNLFHSWKFVSVELSKALGADAKFQNLMILTVINCLRSNATSNLPEAIFERLKSSRAELAFTLLQRLIELKSSDGKLKDILSTAWDTLRAHETDVGLGLTGESADYYRILLKILCLALQAHAPAVGSNNPDTQKDRSDAQSTFQVVLEVLDLVVARGFHSLTTLLHDDSTRVLPADFTLIIAILRIGLQVPGVEKQTTRLVMQFSENQTARCACTLFSWADQIATDNDPVYGEISISFLLELSSVQALAESLAVEGILTHISNANLINYLRQAKGIGPFDSPPRLYSIWSRGILPLLLNLLHGVGAPMAVEIAASLRNFPGQLARASRSFEGQPMSSTDRRAGAITLSTVSEAQTLAVITTVLDTFREAGPSVGINASQIKETGWERAQVRDDIDSLLQRKSVLRDMIFPVNEREEAWVRQPPLSSASGAENRLEEKVVEELTLILGILGGGEQ